MTIRTRIDRLETKLTVGNPIEELSDADLELAIAALRAQIAAESGMSEADLARDDLDPETVHRLVRGLLSEATEGTSNL